MDMIKQGVDVFLHLDVHLSAWSAALGAWLYVVLFVIVFCETGLVVTPVLPGDSLLFAVGALAYRPESHLSLTLLLILLIVAAVLGDAVNYWIGFRLGPKVFRSEHSRLFSKKHLLRTQQFYEKYGGKTIIVARFIPIIRTFAPFVAGIGKMEYRHFACFNVVGGVAWVAVFLVGGYKLGETFKDQFHYVVLGIVVVSVMPLVIEFILARRRRTRETPIPVDAK
jgi:membrane-associated protein